jgi:polysaccharide export outer membrane protein
MNFMFASPVPARRHAPLCSALVAALVIVGAFPAAAQTTAAPSATISQALMPGDMVRLKIWREPDLSGDYRVDERGTATFPKVGEVAVGQLSTDSVRSLLISSYAHFLQQPSVEVTFLRRVQVLGEVKNPGLYNVDATMKLTDVLALAGGVTPTGNTKKIELRRDGKKIPFEISAQVESTDLTLRSGDQLRVPERSWASRNGGIIAAGITGAALLIAAVIRP